MNKSKEVVYAAMHTSVFIPKSAYSIGGTFGPTLDLNGQSRIGKMVLEDGFLTIETKATPRDKATKFAVNLTNVTHLVFKEDNAPNSKAAGDAKAAN